MEEEFIKSNIINIVEARDRRRLKEALNSSDTGKDFWDDLEKNPMFILRNTLSELGRGVHTLAEIISMLELAKKHGIVIEENELSKLLNNFKLDGAHSVALLEIKGEIYKIFGMLREKVTDSIPLEEVRIQSNILEERIREEIRTQVEGGDD